VKEMQPVALQPPSGGCHVCGACSADEAPVEQEAVEDWQLEHLIFDGEWLCEKCAEDKREALGFKV
jgi:hypothetical protein